jgi:D-tyrosyl-tRNA(Tyr) deacylase
MRAVAQRVASASVEVEGQIVGRIERGLLVYLGAADADGAADVEYVAQKIAGLRVFEDDAGKMSRAVAEVSGEVLVVSQFTLFGDVRRGRRPSFDGAAPPAEAERLYEQVIARLRSAGLRVETGRFRANMRVRAEVDGPVTILIDSRKLF